MPVFFALFLACLRPAEGAAFQPPARQFVVHEENNVYFVDEIGRDRFGWPELVKTHRFGTKQDAERFHARQPVAGAAFATAEEAPALVGPAHLWEVKNQWSWDWELRYADWVRANVRPDFFVTHGIATDCADVAYALRWIFARVHQLPMTSRLSTGEWFSEKSVRPDWQELPTSDEWHKDQRFLAALRYLLRLTYTHTLADDAYPVAIRRGSVLEGGFHLTVHGSSGHTQPLTRVLRAGETGLPIEVLQSTMPRAVRELQFDGYWNSEPPRKGMGGLLRFRWPAAGKGLVKPEQMPSFSEEQYDPSFREKEEPFFLAVFRRLWPEIKLEDLALDLTRDTRAAFRRRAEIIRDGYDYCRTNDCRPGTEGWENWSTPSRDERAGQQLGQLKRLVNSLPQEKRAALEAMLLEPVLEVDGIPVAFDLISWSWEEKLYSVDPRDLPTLRWALTPVGLEAYFQKTIRTQWAARNSFLDATSDCAPGLCVPGSDAWNRRYSLAIDFDLQRLPAVARAYCQLTKNLCPALEELLARKFDFFGDLTLAEAMAKFRFLNADPRHPAELRRRLANPLFRTIELPPYSSVFTSRSFLLALGSEASDHSLWDIRGEPTRLRPRRGHWQALNRRSDEAIFTDGNVVGLVDLKSGDTRQVSLPFVPSDVLAGQPGEALARRDRQWAFVRLGREGLRVVSAGAADTLRVIDPARILVTQDGKALLYTGDSPAPTELALSAEAATGTTTKAENGWFLRSGKALYLIPRRDPRAARLSDKLVAFFTARDGLTVYAVEEDQSARVLRLSDTGEILAEKRIAVINLADDGFIAEEGGRRVAHLMNRGEPQSFALLDGETQILAHLDDVVITAKKEGSVVRRIGESRPLLVSTGQIHFLYGETAARQGFVHVCSGHTEGAMRYYGGLCRIENFNAPELYSVFTGVSMGGYAHGYDEDSLERGFAFYQPSSTVWAEYLKP